MFENDSVTFINKEIVMSLKYVGIVLGAFIVAQPVFASDDMGADNMSCKMIVKSCLDAGYTRHEGEGKQFWQDCMKPVITGKQVTGVTVDSKDVKACHDATVERMKKELNDLQ